MPPRLRLHIDLIDKLAFLVGITSGISLLPQAWSVFMHGTDGLAIASFFIIFLNSCVWLAYSIHHGLLSLGIASICNVLTAGFIVFFAITSW